MDMCECRLKEAGRNSWRVEELDAAVAELQEVSACACRLSACVCECFGCTESKVHVCERMCVHARIASMQRTPVPKGSDKHACACGLIA